VPEARGVNGLFPAAAEGQTRFERASPAFPRLPVEIKHRALSHTRRGDTGSLQWKERHLENADWLWEVSGSGSDAFLFGRRPVYTYPVKALVNEKFLASFRDCGAENVGVITGDASVSQRAPNLYYIAEILGKIALRDGEKARVDDVIMDDFHYYPEHERGVAGRPESKKEAHFLISKADQGFVGGVMAI
tara:strand:- start:9657 stop:10226 length:570 start_codon:yes stop_codon:yes gene_type:complete